MEFSSDGEEMSENRVITLLFFIHACFAEVWDQVNRAQRENKELSNCFSDLNLTAESVEWLKGSNSKIILLYRQSFKINDLSWLDLEHMYFCQVHD